MSTTKPKVITAKKLIELLSVDKENQNQAEIDKFYKKLKKEQEIDAEKRRKAMIKEAIKKAKEEEKEDIMKAEEEEKEAIKKAKEEEKEAINKAKEIRQENIIKAKEDKAKNIEKYKKIRVDEMRNKEAKFVKLSKYNIFFKNIQPLIMDMYPGIENRERMGKIGIEWRKHNAMIAKMNGKYGLMNAVSMD